MPSAKSFPMSGWACQPEETKTYWWTKLNGSFRLILFWTVHGSSYSRPTWLLLIGLLKSLFYPCSQVQSTFFGCLFRNALASGSWSDWDVDSVSTVDGWQLLRFWVLPTVERPVDGLMKNLELAQKRQLQLLVYGSRGPFTWAVAIGKRILYTLLCFSGLCPPFLPNRVAKAETTLSISVMSSWQSIFVMLQCWLHG